jgi:predicted nuclease of predicted toxin-antitoxin system
VRVLLDENLPHKLRTHLAKHETVTVGYLGWGGLSNGELLDAAEVAGFDVLMTGDRTLEYEQNLEGRKISVVSLSSNNWPIIKNHVARIASAIGSANPGSLTRVECGVFSRRRPKPDGPTLT